MRRWSFMLSGICLECEQWANLQLIALILLITLIEDASDFLNPLFNQ